MSPMIPPSARIPPSAMIPPSAVIPPSASKEARHFASYNLALSVSV